MRGYKIPCLLFALLLSLEAGAQSSASLPSYELHVAIDEVNLLFSAMDADGLPLNDLKMSELEILENGKPPAKIFEFHVQQDFPMRAGILIDTSKSMEQQIARNKSISSKFTQLILRQKTDQAFIMDFGSIWEITQPWTSDPLALSYGIQKVSNARVNPGGGTSINDTLFRTCLYEFGKINHAASGNFILLFSDGEDNHSFTELQDVVDTCQRSHTAIYAFYPQADSIGTRTLAQLTSETGGRLFNEDESDTEIEKNLRLIESDLRNQYSVSYKPVDLKHDGSFHQIAIKAPARVQSVFVRSGYYAPKPTR
jgi:VWFA-related protein